MNSNEQDQAPEISGLDTRPLYEELNIAEKIRRKKDGEDKLNLIGDQCRKGFEEDLASRQEWEDEIEEWMKLAKQVREKKTFPWDGASNIKYPLISVAAIQFSARAYPSLVPADGKLVKTRIVGKDPDGEKAKKADRISKYMSWQFSEGIPYWEEEFDKLLMTLSIVGCMFKKTYFDPTKGEVASKVIFPKNLVVNHCAVSLDTAERVSEIIPYYEREVKNKMRSGLWLKHDLGKFIPVPNDETEGIIPYEFIEQHTWLDLDDDDYEEPYVVTFERHSGTVVRIAARYNEESLTFVGDKIANITPFSYYTKYPFIPNPDGGFYDIGFGHLLGPINEAINTLANQEIDAGTLANLQGGFLGKGLRIKGGEAAFQPGEWKFVNQTGDDLRKQIFPLPVREPSKVLFELFGALVTAGKELASVAEIFVGKMPGQNTPATTTMASIEQGMKVFTAVYKRVYRALDEEFKKVFELNRLYLDDNTLVNVLDEPVSAKDFDWKSFDIVPTADPTATSQQEKMLKAQALLEQLSLGILDPIKVQIRMLEAQEQPNWEELIPGMKETGQPQIPPKPDPALLEMEMKQKAEQASFDLKAKQADRDFEMNKRSKEFEMMMKEQNHAQNMRHQQQMNELKAKEALHKQNIFIREKQSKIQADRIKAASDIEITRAKASADIKRKAVDARTSKRVEKSSSK